MTITNRFILQWAGLTALLGAAMTIPSAHSMYFYVLILVVGLAMGIGQWWLLRDTIDRAWQWIVASMGGWIVGFILTGGLFYLLGAIMVRQTGELNVPSSIVKVFEVFTYTALFGIMGAVQSLVLWRKQLDGRRWILFNVVGGTLLGVVFMLVCAAGDGTFLDVLMSESDEPMTQFCVNIGLTLPRLQTAEPIFNVVPLSYTAHIAGWVVYGIVSAFGMKSVIAKA